MAAVTVTGKGNISVKPDLIDLGLNILTKDKDCGNAMDKAGSALEELRSILESCGFERYDLKTSDFSVRTEYETVPDENGNYRNVFKGYCCTHALHVSFPMDTQRLADVLGRSAGTHILIGGCSRNIREVYRQRPRVRPRGAHKPFRRRCAKEGGAALQSLGSFSRKASADKL